ARATRPVALPTRPDAPEASPARPAAPARRPLRLPRPPRLPPPPRVDEKLPFTAHLAELRTRLLYCGVAIVAAFVLAYWQSDRLVAFLLAPLLPLLPPESPVVFTQLTEPFITYIKLAFYTALFVSSPVWLTHAWAFVAPGLYEHERRVALPLVAASVVAFLAGGAFCYYVAFPVMFRFFLSFHSDILLAAPAIRDYLDLTLKLVLAFGLAFEYPVAILILARLGVVTGQWLRKVRGYATVAIFALAAVVTPPDLLSQLLFALPVLGLYEVGIWIAWLVGRRRPARPAGDEPPDSPHAAPPAPGAPR
ncbi:MAG TPA: twin-arginine translocase subunit TatC, partial [Thermodesulfobacteriota bacterium]|nr:twin-arginine translocase subunit TatC [Thermodesulfobacteriota bacterium]